MIVTRTFIFFRVNARGIRQSSSRHPAAGRDFQIRLAATQPDQPARAFPLDESLESFPDYAGFILQTCESLGLGHPFIIQNERGAHGGIALCINFGVHCCFHIGIASHTRYTTYGENMPTTSPKMGRKIKKSFSISIESDSFIRKSCKERKSKSESETLDALLRELMAVRQRKAMEAAYTDYYDSLNEDEAAEESAWGRFAESQLAKEAR